MGTDNSNRFCEGRQEDAGRQIPHLEGEASTMNRLPCLVSTIDFAAGVRIRVCRREIDLKDFEGLNTPTISVSSFSQIPTPRVQSISNVTIELVV
jgi:hypothetical protein